MAKSVKVRLVEPTRKAVMMQKMFLCYLDMRSSCMARYVGTELFGHFLKR